MSTPRIVSIHGLDSRAAEQAAAHLRRTYADVRVEVPATVNVLLTDTPPSPASPSDLPIINVLTAALKVRQAVVDEGPRPDLHRKELSHLRNKWPTLYRTVYELIDAIDEART